MEWDKVSPELDKIVASLGERDRDAVVLRFFGGKSFAEIGSPHNSTTRQLFASEPRKYGDETHHQLP